MKKLVRTLFIVFLLTLPSSPIFALDKNAETNIVNVTVPSELKIKMLKDGTNAISDYTITNYAAPIEIDDIYIQKLGKWSLVSSKAKLQPDSYNMILKMDDTILKHGNNNFDITINTNESFSPELSLQRGLVTKQEESKAFKFLIRYQATQTKLMYGLSANKKLKTLGTIKEIVFSHDIMPQGVKSVDISENGDASVIAWIEGNKVTISNQSKYQKIIFNESSGYLFHNLYYVSSIDFGDNVIDTSNVKWMPGMFEWTGAYADSLSLDLSEFDVSNVTNAEFMFFYTGWKVPALSLDLSMWDLSKVENMQSMFRSMGEKSASWVLKTPVNIPKDANKVNILSTLNVYDQNGNLMDVNGANFPSSNPTSYILKK